ncbi:MAG: thioredoxin family protein [Comamonas sp.]
MNNPEHGVVVPSQAQQAPAAQWRVLCLCAAWCGVCRQYEPEFTALQSRFPQVQFDWIDVEDQEALLGEVEVETFPSLLLGQGAQPLFFGPLLPQIKVLERLLESLMQAPSTAAAQPEEVQALWQRVLAQST